MVVNRELQKLLITKSGLFYTPTLITMNIKNLFWIAPFLSFFLGYLTVHRIMRTPEIMVPNLVGKHVHTILPIITQYNLNIRLIDQKEEPDLPEGIILNQTPISGTTVKQNQPIYVVTTKKPIATRAPQCVGMQSDELHHQLKTNNIDARIYYLSHPYPEKICFAQSPRCNESIEKNKLTLYISSGNNKPIIWPDFTQHSLQNVVNFLDMYQIQPHIINDYEHLCYTDSKLVVIDQRPVAGTLLTMDEQKPLSVQLRVQPIR
jgi:beta-lactam-binding protein with PASTA domain